MNDAVLALFLPYLADQPIKILAEAGDLGTGKNVNPSDKSVLFVSVFYRQIRIHLCINSKVALFLLVTLRDVAWSDDLSHGRYQFLS